MIEWGRFVLICVLLLTLLSLLHWLSTVAPCLGCWWGQLWSQQPMSAARLQQDGHVRLHPRLSLHCQRVVDVAGREASGIDGWPLGVERNGWIRQVRCHSGTSLQSDLLPQPVPATDLLLQSEPAGAGSPELYGQYDAWTSLEGFLKILLNDCFKLVQSGHWNHQYLIESCYDW